ncbi:MULTISPECIES: hypothetical protein [Aestuariivivens]|nr:MULTISPECIES: hypothetical protein [Aestuariivivens]
MNPKNDYFRELIKLVLPEEIFEYFEIVKLEVKEKSVDVKLALRIHTRCV